MQKQRDKKNVTNYLSDRVELGVNCVERKEEIEIV